MTAPMLHSSFEEGFADAVSRGELRYPRCMHCLQPLDFSQRRCPAGHAGVTWERASGRANLVSWTVYHQQYEGAPRTPYVIGQVVLAEGPQLVAALDLGAIPPAAGLPLQLGGFDGARAVFVPSAKA